VAKEIVTWCDPCLDIEMHNAGYEHEVSLDGQKPTVIDMCEECAKAWLDPLRELLEKHGQPSLTRAPATSRSRARSRSEEEGRVKCLYCPATYGNEQSGGMRQHLRSMHGVDMKLLTHGRCPVCGDATKRLGSHLAAHHPSVKSTTSAFEWARDSGDPFGRYAEVMRLEKLQVERRS
jgi:hypothetical protein